MVKNTPVMQETWGRSLGREDPLEKGMATHSRNLLEVAQMQGPRRVRMLLLKSRP